GAVLAHGAAQAVGRDLEPQLVARHHRLAEARPVDADQIVGNLAVGRIDGGIALEGKQGRRLRHGLDDEHARHYGVMRKMAFEERLVHGHVLDGHDAFARLHFKDPVDQQHRVSMRQAGHDFLDVEFHSFLSYRRHSHMRRQLLVVFFKGAQALAQLRKLPQHRCVALPADVLVERVYPGVAPGLFDVGGDGRAPRDVHVVAQDDVAGKHGGTAYGAAGADDRGAGDADAGRHGGVVAYAHVVRHHDLVVELDPVADDGVFEGAAVDGGVGADLDVVAYLDPAQLSDFSPGARLAARIRGKTEAVGAQHRAAVHND